MGFALILQSLHGHRIQQIVMRRLVDNPIAEPVQAEQKDVRALESFMLADRFCDSLVVLFCITLVQFVRKDAEQGVSVL